MSNPDEFPFEEIPRKALPIPIARSKLLSAISVELSTESQKTEGKKVMRLSDLGSCPDQELKPVIPTVLPESKIMIKGGDVYGESPVTGKSYRLFALDSCALTVFNLFNGSTTLETISKTLAQETGWTQERSFAYTRGVFLALVAAGLCTPKE